MKTVRSLPPELQRLIDEYNSLLKDAGYVNPFIPAEYDEPAGNIKYSSPDGDPETDSKAGFNARDYRDSKLTYQQFEDRGKMILNKYYEIMDLGKKLIEEGKITAVPNPRIGKPNTYIYDRVYEYPENPIRGKTYYVSAHMPEVPMFRDINRPSPMKPLKKKSVAGAQGSERPGLQESRSMNIPQVEKELIMRSNPRMRTGQEPGYYVIREEGKRPIVRPVEEEERQYYRNRNRIGR